MKFFKNISNGYKLSASVRSQEKPLEPSTEFIWARNFISEILATFWIAMCFAGLFIYLPNGEEVISYLGNGIFVALYSGFFVIGVFLLLFVRWSADGNPAISIYKAITGIETYRYAFAKIIMQFIGASLAGLVIYFLTSDPAKTASKFVDPNFANNYGFFPNGILGETKLANVGLLFWALAIELIVGLILLWSVFSNKIVDKYRNLMVLIMTTFGTFIGATAGILNFNMARGYAQFFPAIITGEFTSTMGCALAGIMLGNLLAPFALVLLDNFGEKYLSVWFKKAIDFKNPKLHEQPAFNQPKIEVVAKKKDKSRKLK